MKWDRRDVLIVLLIGWVMVNFANLLAMRKERDAYKMCLELELRNLILECRRH